MASDTTKFVPSYLRKQKICTWRKAVIRFNKETAHDLIDYGNSTRGCQIIPAGSVREVYFENWKQTPRYEIVFLGCGDTVPMFPGDFDIITMDEEEIIGRTPYKELK